MAGQTLVDAISAHHYDLMKDCLALDNINLNEAVGDVLPLHEAVRQNDYEMVCMLLLYNAYPMRQEPLSGHTALHEWIYKASDGEADLRIAETLMNGLRKFASSLSASALLVEDVSGVTVLEAAVALPEITQLRVFVKYPDLLRAEMTRPDENGQHRILATAMPDAHRELIADMYYRMLAPSRNRAPPRKRAPTAMRPQARVTLGWLCDMAEWTVVKAHWNNYRALVKRIAESKRERALPKHMKALLEEARAAAATMRSFARNAPRQRAVQRLCRRYMSNKLYPRSDASRTYDPKGVRVHTKA